jgi:hypothetical protein
MDTAERSLGIAVLPLGGDLQVVGIGMSGVCSYMPCRPFQFKFTLSCHRCPCSQTAAAIAEVVLERLDSSHHLSSVVHHDWNAATDADVILFVIEVESDGSPSETARKFLRSLKKQPPPLGGALDSKRVGVLALARNVCAFSAGSGGSNKYSGAAKLQKALIDAGATLLVPMGSAEVEMEEVEVSIIPWVDTVADACAVVQATPWTTNAAEHARPSAVAEPRCDLTTVARPRCDLTTVAATRCDLTTVARPCVGDACVGDACCEAHGPGTHASVLPSRSSDVRNKDGSSPGPVTVLAPDTQIQPDRIRSGSPLWDALTGGSWMHALTMLALVGVAACAVVMARGERARGRGAA